MKKIISEWQIEHDPDLTMECYKELKDYECTCAPCRNFMAALEGAFAPEFRSLANTLGINLRKAAEVYHMAREESGLHYMGGWFHFVGTMQDEDSGGSIRTLRNKGQDFQFDFSSHLALVSNPFVGHPLIQLEFYTRVPWVVSDPEEV